MAGFIAVECTESRSSWEESSLKPYMAMFLERLDYRFENQLVEEIRNDCFNTDSFFCIIIIPLSAATAAVARVVFQLRFS